MSVKIFYFSGTGNSLLLGRKIAVQVKEAELLPAISLYGGTSKKVEADAVGFVFPVYCLDMPDFIREIIDKNDFSRVEYFFAAVTCGGTPGNALSSLDRKLRTKGEKLNCGFEVKMGDNSIVYVTSQENLKQRMERLEDVSSEIAAMVNKRETTGQVYEFKADSALMKNQMNKALSMDFKINMKSAIKEKCNLCGLCTEVCPVRNIKIVNGNVEWGDNCKLCFACLNWCPQSAVCFGKIEPGPKQQYRCPGISASDIICKGDEVQFFNKPDNNTEKVY
ncbi:EFR1 family ferrodoxin [Clostridium sp. BJN0013]|uniref:EFR1 family ferrodoxin n=1 Tax=Clostridium sp. BJN0013 TaxID=3236840 RepID=UPI0034C6965A